MTEAHSDHSRSFSRRDFLRKTAVGGGVAFALPFVHTSAAGAESRSPNEKLNLAFVGTASRASANISGLQNENIYALCDVWEDAIHAAKEQFMTGRPAAKQTNDWRRLMDDDAIDAVVMSATDHHHAPCAIAAMRAGKHVYCEKPLSHTVVEARMMQDVYNERRDQIATQMGTQIHAGDNYRRVVELVRSGVIGPIAEVHVWCGRDPGPLPGKLAQEQVPSGFDWDVWLGPAEMRPYNSAYWQGGCTNWHRRWEFGIGVLGDMSGHLIDLPFWALDLRRPKTVSAVGPTPDPVECPKWLVVSWEHGKRDAHPAADRDLSLHWYHGVEGVEDFRKKLQPKLGDNYDLRQMGQGIAFVGESGVIVADYGQRFVFADDADASDVEIEPIANSIGHYNEWTKACKTGSPTTCNFDYSGALIEHNLLGACAFRSGKKLEWDPKAMRFPNAPDANQYLTKEYRKGWEIDA